MREEMNALERNSTWEIVDKEGTIGYRVQMDIYSS